MPTIVKAYAVTEPTLLQSINEDGWLSKIGKGLGFNKDKPAPAAPAAPSTPDVAKPRADIEAGDPLGHVVSAILNPVQDGQVRVVVRMSKAQLSSLYLKDDPAAHAQLAASIAKSTPAPAAAKPAAKKPAAPKKPAAKKPAAAKPAPTTAAQPAPTVPADASDVRGMQQTEQFAWLKAIVNEDDAPPPQAPKPSSVLALNPGYKFSDLIKGAAGTEVSVLLDVPDSIYHAYKTAATPEDRTKALTQMFNHKYYAMSISNSEAAKIAPTVDKHTGDMEAEKAAINPGIIVNHPGAQTIKFAKKEWHEKYSEKHSGLSGSGKPSDAAKPEESKNPADDAEDKLAQSVAMKPAQDASVPPPADQKPAEPTASAPTAAPAAEVPKWKQMKDAKKAGWVKEITSVKDIHSQLADYADKPKMVKLLNDRLGEILAKTG